MRTSTAHMRVCLAACVAGIVFLGNARSETAETRTSATFAGSVFSVVSFTDGRQNAEGTAFAIARHGWIITSAKLVEDADQVSVKSKLTGALDAKIVAVDPSSDLALLRVSAALHPLVFAEKEPANGDVVSSISFGDDGPVSSRGALGGTLTGFDPLLTHNALFGRSGYGGALVNECNEIVGLDRIDPTAAPGGLPDSPHEYAVAATIGQMEAFSAHWGVPFGRARQACVSALTRVTNQAHIARARADVAEKKAAQLGASQLVSEREKETAQQAAEDARRSANAAERDAARARAAAEQRRKAVQAATSSMQRTRRLALWGGIAAAVAILAVVALSLIFIFRGRKKRRAAEEAALSAHEKVVRATTPPVGARDLLLEGTAPNGERFAIKIPALALGEAHGGAVIGRNPGDAEFVINREKVSRKHCRLFVSGQKMQIEDLGSTNGTGVNGQLVHKPETIREGDMVHIGDVTLRLKFITSE